MSTGRKRSLSGPACSSPAKRKKYLCKYQKAWEADSDRSVNDAYCILCKSHLSIGSGAKNDLTRHAKSQNHMQLEMVQRKSKSMFLFVTTPNNSLKSNIEQFWGEMGKLDDIFSGTKRFGVLSKLAKTLLVLPNSNADSERAFSIIKKIHTEFRSDLNNDTICGLLSCKFNQNQCCYEYQPSTSVLKSAKSATSDYNQSLESMT